MALNRVVYGAVEIEALVEEVDDHHGRGELVAVVSELNSLDRRTRGRM